MRYCLALILFFYSWSFTVAQDTVLVLPEATVIKSINGYVKEQQALHVTSLRSATLSDLLFSEIGVNIRSNSAQGLSTINFRGFGPDQTRISWNGLPLNNPMNGQIDLSLVPVFFLDNVSISGETSTTAFNNPVGGELSLSSGIPVNRDSLNWNLRPHLGVGSFGRLAGGLDYTFFTRKISLRSRVYYSEAENNYPYYPFGKKSGDLKLLSHAFVEGLGMMQDISFGKSRISVWTQNTKRDLPPTMLENSSEKNQSDRHMRVSYNLSDSNRLGLISIKAGFSSEELEYTDKVNRIYSENRSINGFISLQQGFQTKNNVHWNSGFDGQIASSKTTQYGLIDPLCYFTLRQNVNWHSGKWRLSSGIKLTSKEVDRFYLLPSGHLKYQWSTHVLSSLSYQRGLNFPTTNQLYWQPGGNPKVGVEESDNMEFRSILIKKRYKIILTIYGARIYNRIQWLPNQSGLYVVTQDKGNISNNYGFTLQTKGFIDLLAGHNIKLIWSANYHFTRSVKNLNDRSIQNIFIPIHQVGGRIGIKLKDFYFGWSQSYVSERFTTTTNDDWMKGYVLSDLVLSINKNKWTASVRVFNMFNQYYEMLPLRPMPMRSIQLNLQHSIQNKK